MRALLVLGAILLPLQVALAVPISCASVTSLAQLLTGGVGQDGCFDQDKLYSSALARTDPPLLG